MVSPGRCGVLEAVIPLLGRSVDIIKTGGFKVSALGSKKFHTHPAWRNAQSSA
jgi:hypothetical protein